MSLALYYYYIIRIVILYYFKSILKLFKQKLYYGEKIDINN